MSVEVKFLANKMNRLDLNSDKAKDDKVYEEGKNQFEIIKRDIGFISATGLATIEKYLDENGLLVYNKWFRKYVERR